MEILPIEIKLLSQTLIGSAEGFGAVIDADIVFDDAGIPLIPGRRLKGCLKDSALSVFRMFTTAGIYYPFSDKKQAPLINRELIKHYDHLIEQTFGKPGGNSPLVYFPNLVIEDYEKNHHWLRYLLNHYDNILSVEAVVNTYTDIRQQTAVDFNGVTRDRSLRTMRVLQKGLVFHGDIRAETSCIDTVKTLALACANLRYMGTQRNRGFGEIDCHLADDRQYQAMVIKELEELCGSTT